MLCVSCEHTHVFHSELLPHQGVGFGQIGLEVKERLEGRGETKGLATNVRMARGQRACPESHRAYLWVRHVVWHGDVGDGGEADGAPEPLNGGRAVEAGAWGATG